MIDLEIARYAQEKQKSYRPIKSVDGNPILRKRAVVKTLLSGGQSSPAYHAALKRIRESAHLKNEGHNKQVAMLLNRERFAQNQTWQTEYDRLASRAVPQELQPFVNARLEELKNLLINK